MPYPKVYCFRENKQICRTSFGLDQSDLDLAVNYIAVALFSF